MKLHRGVRGKCTSEDNGAINCPETVNFLTFQSLSAVESSGKFSDEQNKLAIGQSTKLTRLFSVTEQSERLPLMKQNIDGLGEGHKNPEKRVKRPSKISNYLGIDCNCNLCCLCIFKCFTTN